MNSSEAQIIGSYLAERTRMFRRNPAHAASRTFYELWEKLCCPQPFPVTKNTLILDGTLLRFPRHRGTDAGTRRKDARACGSGPPTGKRAT